MSEPEEKLIDMLSKMIINQLLEKYSRKEKANEVFYRMVFSLIPEKYQVYKEAILQKVIYLIPINLYICPNQEYIFVEEKEYNSLLNNNDINGLTDIAKNITNEIVKKYSKMESVNKDIFDIFNEFIPKEYDNITNRNIRQRIYQNLLNKKLLSN